MKRSFLLLCAVLLVLGCALPCAAYRLACMALAQSAAPSAAEAASAASEESSEQEAPSPADTADTVCFMDQSTGQTVTLPLREYLIGAVAAEMPVSWPDEALKAQAVAAHSYALYRRDHSTGENGAWFTADPARRQGCLTDAVLHSYWGTAYAANYARLSALVDAVQASKVVSARTSSKLIHKLEALCSDYEGTQLQRQVYVDGRPKTDSQTLLYSIDALHTAINRGCLVQFRYKGSSAVRTVSPWQLAWENGCYYLIAYQDEKAPPVRHYRVDRMAGVLVLDEPRRGKEFFRTFDLPAYLRKHFNMFGGTEYRVTLRCAADLEPVMRERFGREPVFCPEEDGYFHFDVPICVSQQFFGWVCGFGGKVEVTAPAAVRAQLHEMVQSLAEQHR